MKNRGRLASRIIAVIVCSYLPPSLPEFSVLLPRKRARSESPRSPTFTILLIPKKEQGIQRTDSAKPTTNGTTKVPVSTTKSTPLST